MEKKTELLPIMRLDPRGTSKTKALTAGTHKEITVLERKPGGKGRGSGYGAPPQFLPHVELFSSLTKNEFEKVRSKLILKEYHKNQVILHEEETGEYMYIIVQGKVKISRVAKEGKEIILSMHGAGEFFGEMALIDGKTIPATVSAMENSLVALISRDDFFLLLYAQNKILRNLLQILCTRLREAWKLIHILNFNDASQRVKMLFLTLSEVHGEKTASGTMLKIKLTHQDIADMVGLTRETVTRVLDKLKRDGEITISKNKLVNLAPEFESIQL